MKRIMYKLTALGLAVTCAAAPVLPAMAASKAKTPALSGRKVSVQVKKKKTITVKNVKKVTNAAVFSKRIASAKVKGRQVVLTGKNAGMSTVTITVKDLNGKTKNLRCTVTVKAAAGKKQVAVQGIRLNHYVITLKKGESYQLKVSCKPANAAITGKVKWSSRDERYATVSSDGTVTGKAVGITAVRADYENHYDTCIVAVGTNTKAALAQAAKGNYDLNVSEINQKYDPEITRLQTEIQMTQSNLIRIKDSAELKVQNRLKQDALKMVKLSYDKQMVVINAL